MFNRQRGQIMTDGINRRIGVRVKVNRSDGIEAVIYTDESFPNFCDEYEINLGGLKIGKNIEHYDGKQVTVCIFGQNNQQLELSIKIVQSSDLSSAIKFDQLTAAQEQTLRGILALQLAL